MSLPLRLTAPCHSLHMLQYCGESDLQLERINVYFNEATGGACASEPNSQALLQ